MPKAPIILKRGKGRRYDCGRLEAHFKADEDETDCSYAASEWWMEPGFDGVGPHHHDANEELFYVIEGAPEFLVGEDWKEVAAGTFIRVPPGMTHDFRNRSGARAGFLNIYIPGGFERDMPSIVKWFADNPD